MKAMCETVSHCLSTYDAILSVLLASRGVEVSLLGVMKNAAVA